MGHVTLGFPGTQPTAVYPVNVYTKSEWGGQWSYRPDIECLGFSLHAASMDLDRADIGRRYGQIKQPWETATAWVTALNIVGSWLRLDVSNESGVYSTAWIGRISGEARDVFGRDPVPSGYQTWTAYGPLQLLRKMTVSESYWFEATGPIGWIPTMNERLPRHGNKGNMGTWQTFGGNNKWTHKDHIDYLLYNVVNDGDGPRFHLAGQYSVLSQIKETIDFGSTPTIADMLAALIPTRFGLDYFFRPASDGFDIVVFPLSAESQGFGSALMPANENSVSIVAGVSPEIISCRLVLSEDHGYGRVRVIGARIVACFTIHKDPDISNEELVPKWTDEDEAKYRQPGKQTPEENDEARKDSRLEDVYRSFGAPANWQPPAPYTNEYGVLSTSAYYGAYQLTVRKTLSWLPLVAGMDYTVDPPVPVAAAPSDTDAPEYMHPLGWIAMREEGSEVDKYTPLDKLDPPIGFEVAQHDWGVRLHATPNHVMALNHWNTASKPVDASDYDPIYDYEKLRFTLAMECDQRMTVTMAIPGAGPCDGTLDVEVPDAQLWILSGSTMVGVDNSGIEELSPTDDVVLRDDSDRLLLVMAGTISRYMASRMRASIVVRGTWPWSSILGAIMLSVNEGNQVDHVKAPITSLVWSGGKTPTTVIWAGYAG